MTKGFFQLMDQVFTILLLISGEEKIDEVSISNIL